MNQITLSTTAQRPANCELRRNDPTKTVTAADWQWPLTAGLSVGIGIPFARFVVPAVWPGLDAFWGRLVTNSVTVGLAAAIITLGIGLFRLARKR